MTYEIRKTTLSDLPYLPSVERSASSVFRAFPKLTWVADADVMSSEAHRHLLSEGFCWVAVDIVSRSIAGFIAAEIICGDCYIIEVSVANAHQRKGLGQNLFEAALKEATSLGVTAATLTTFIDVPWNAPYYQRLGFDTLPPEALQPYLRDKLQAEKTAGFPINRRCVMRKLL